MPYGEAFCPARCVTYFSTVSKLVVECGVVGIMKLIVGGYAQGKLDYVRLKYHLQADMVWDSVLPICENDFKDTDSAGNTIVVNHFHRWVRTCMTEGGCPEDEIRVFLKDCENRNIDCIIISDEIGNGIVPIDAFEREYRERVGRILVQLAEQAEEVERVLCGIGQKIK